MQKFDKTLDILRKQRVSYEDTDRAAAKGRPTTDFLGKKMAFHLMVVKQWITHSFSAKA